MTSLQNKPVKIEFTISPDESDKLIVDLIAEKSTLSKSLIKKLMLEGAVFQTYKKSRIRARKAKRTSKKGDLIECFYDPKYKLDQVPHFSLLYTCKYYGIYHKPANAPLEGSNYGDRSSLYRHVEKTKKFVHLVNRVDYEVEGLVIIAYDSKTQNLLQQMLRESITKKYQAIVQGKLIGSGKFTTPIQNKFSETLYVSQNIQNEQSQVEIQLISERKKQIQTHFAQAGHPIIKSEQKLLLIGHHIGFIDPYTKKSISVTIPKEKWPFVTSLES